MLCDNPLVVGEVLDLKCDKCGHLKRFHSPVLGEPCLFCAVYTLSDLWRRDE